MYTKQNKHNILIDDFYTNMIDKLIIYRNECAVNEARMTFNATAAWLMMECN